jgi:Carboxypeptidase regulatory-like domain
MTTRSERLNRLVIASPCQESWQTMSGGESTRFCSRCQKRVYDLAALEACEIDTLIEATQGRLCARITRDRSGRIVTREPDAYPFHLPDAAPVRRASPMVAAVVTAIVGMTGAGWAEPPVSPPIAAAPVSPDAAHPSGPGRAALSGQVVDDQGSPLPGTTILLRHSKEGWKLNAVSDAQGRFQLRDIPSGVYDVEAELEGFDFGTVTGLALGPEGGQVTFTGTPSETISVTVGVIAVSVDLPLDTVFQQSHVVVAAIVGPSVTLEELDAGEVRHVRTELRITSVLKGKSHGGTLQIDHYVISGQPGNFSPGDVVLALLDPLDDSGPDSRIYISADPVYALRPIPPYPRLSPELGVDEAAWQAMSYIANAMDNDELQDLVTRSITQLKEARRQLAGDEKSLRARTAAIEKELRRRFMEMLNGGS